MIAAPAAIAVALVVLVGALVLDWRRRAEIARLGRRLDAAVGRLEHLQTSFARFAPARVVDRIAATGVAAAAEKKEVTVLFADIVGFTSLGEDLDADVLVRILNEYFVRMSAVIREHRGHVAKFIGDGMMALFGALEPNPWQTNDAVHAALGMREALQRYNRELAAAGLPELAFGIGIHRGVAVAGILGSHELLEFTVIGSPVNLASRVERLTREHGADVLITGAARAQLDPRFRLRELPPVVLRGASKPSEIFAVEGLGD
jgi:adenylate cyclase